MKVLHIGQRIKGGTATHLCEVLPAQLAVLGENSVRLLIPADQIVHVPDVPRHAILTYGSSRRSPGALLNMLRRAASCIHDWQPDVVHLHSSFAGLVRLLPSLRQNGRRIVYCSHGWSFNMRVAPRQQRAYGWMEALLARRTDRILCISDYELATARDRGIAAERMMRVYNGIADHPSTTNRAHPPAIDRASINLLFIGRDDRQKGYDTLVQAMDRLSAIRPDITLHAIGPSSGMVGASHPGGQAAARIVEHGWLDRDRLPAWIDACDALVMPSRWEGFGLVAVEAMRQCRAVYAARVDALPELVIPGLNGDLFPPDDPDALAACLAELERPLLTRMGKAGRAIFLERFTAGRMNAAILDSYRG